MTRTAFLREKTMDSVHKAARIALPDNWDTSKLECSLPQRKAYAIAKVLEEMPLYIGEQELIVGTRTVYGHKNEAENKSDMEITALPHYVNEEDISYFGTNGENYTKGHYTAGYERLLKMGICGIINYTKKEICQQTLKEKIDFLDSIIIAYQGLSRLIERYSEYAKKMADAEENPIRKAELEKISEVCANIKTEPPANFQEAAQLFWFSHLSLIIENFWAMNYGRVDQFLFPYYNPTEKEQAQQLVDCLLLKMYDGLDLIMDRTGNYAGQHNITLGGLTKDGFDGVNEVSFLFVDGLSRTRLPEPEVSVRIHSKNPIGFLRKCSELSITGLNCIAYYNDDLFIKSLVNAGIAQSDANDYAFDLCQDINIPGRGDFYTSGGVDLARVLLQAMRESNPDIDFAEFMKIYKEKVSESIHESIESYNLSEKAIREYTTGNQAFLFDCIKAGTLPPSACHPLMSPLPLTSALYDGCIENAADISWFGCVVEDRGYMVTNLVVALNSLAAIHKYIFDEGKYTIAEVLAACDSNFAGNEVMRQTMWNAPKWANDDDFVDLPAKEIIEFACDEVLKHSTPNGARHLAGIHQPHPVFAGETLQATPEGRLAGQPIPVTLSPENGTMLNGPTAAFRSASKIDPLKYQWNNCVMLQYFSSVFEGNDGADLFSGMLLSYFNGNGAQHQPNVVNVADLKAAQVEPDKYRDLIVRMWGVSAHFVDLPRDVQDEFISRFVNI